MLYVRERVDLGGLGVSGDGAEAGEGVRSVDVHGAGATDTLSAGATKSERRVNLILYLDEHI